MARDMVARHELRGILRCESPIRVAGGAGDGFADVLVARDGLGRPILPGTSLAGALRAWLGTVFDTHSGVALFSESDLRLLFGDLELHTENGVPCQLAVEDAAAVGDVVPVVRDGVGIDRFTGSAADKLLCRHEVVPAGSRFGFRLVGQANTPNGGRVAEAIGLLAAGLIAGRIPVGAARTRGLARVVLETAQQRTVGLQDTASLARWLTGQAAWAPVIPNPREQELLAADGRLSITISWRPDGPLMVQDSIQGGDVDTIPLTVADEHGVRLLMPGSSVKGVLRSQAERISRTVLDLDGQAVSDSRMREVRSLFGAIGGRDDKNKAETGRRGAIAVADCHGEQRISAADWGDVLTSKSPPGRARVKPRSGPKWRISDHVAIDRWTGGAADQLLFSVLEPAQAHWEPLRLSVDTRRTGTGDDARTNLALLLLVLRDLHDGWLRLGFGGSRGRGAIVVEEVSFGGVGLSGGWQQLAGRNLRQLIAERPAAVVEAFDSWQARAAKAAKVGETSTAKAGG